MFLLSKAREVAQGEKLRVRRRGGKSKNKDRKKRNFSVKGASVFCFNEPKCFRLRVRENHRKGKGQETEPRAEEKIYLKVKKDNQEIHSEEVSKKLKPKVNGRKSRKNDDQSRKRKRTRICPSLEFEEPGDYKLVVEKDKEEIFWDFKIQPIGKSSY